MVKVPLPFVHSKCDNCICLHACVCASILNHFVSKKENWTHLEYITHTHMHVCVFLFNVLVCSIRILFCSAKLRQHWHGKHVYFLHILLHSIDETSLSILISFVIYIQRYSQYIFCAPIIFALLSNTFTLFLTHFRIIYILFYFILFVRCCFFVPSKYYRVIVFFVCVHKSVQQTIW